MTAEKAAVPKKSPGRPRKSAAKPAAAVKHEVKAVVPPAAAPSEVASKDAFAVSFETLSDDSALVVEQMPPTKAEVEQGLSIHQQPCARVASSPSSVDSLGEGSRVAAVAMPQQDHVCYRALTPCRIGHYRDKGDVFVWERFTPCPEHLEEVTGGEADSCLAAQTEPVTMPRGRLGPLVPPVRKPAAVPPSSLLVPEWHEQAATAAATPEAFCPVQEIGPTLDDLGFGEPLSAAQVTSGDMLP